jgi:flagellar biosynthesis chaperone FliJ
MKSGWFRLTEDLSVADKKWIGPPGSGGSPVMTTLVIPSFEPQEKLLQTVEDEVSAKPVSEWSEQTLQLCLDQLRSISKTVNEMHQLLEEKLAAGVEARSFARDYNRHLAITSVCIAKIRRLIERASSAKDRGSKSLAAELNSVEQKIQAFHNLLADALAPASEARRPVDWERVRASEEAHARGETKPFSRR